MLNIMGLFDWEWCIQSFIGGRPQAGGWHSYVYIRTYIQYLQSVVVHTYVYYLTHWVGKLSYSSTALLLTIERTWASDWCVHITELVAKYSAVCEALQGLPSMAFFWYVTETAVPIGLLSVRTLLRQWLPTHCCTCVWLCTRLPAGHLGVGVGRMVWCPGNGLPSTHWCCEAIWCIIELG